MSLKENIIKIWKTKNQILEGVTNSIFKKEDIEEIANERMQICYNCSLFTHDDNGCMIPGTGPCCDKRREGCGCSLKFKTRSLSSNCPFNKWKAELTQEEEDQLNQKLGI